MIDQKQKRLLDIKLAKGEITHDQYTTQIAVLASPPPVAGDSDSGGNTQQPDSNQDSVNSDQYEGSSYAHPQAPGTDYQQTDYPATGQSNDILSHAGNRYGYRPRTAGLPQTPIQTPITGIAGKNVKTDKTFLIGITVGVLLLLLAGVIAISLALAPKVNRITISPNSIKSHIAGEEKRITAEIFDTYGNRIEVEPLSWSTSNSTVARIISDNRKEASNTQGAKIVIHGSGEATIKVQFKKISASMTVLARLVDKVRIEEKELKLKIGKTDRLSATAVDEKDEEIRDVKLKWSVKDPAIATVNTRGVVTAKKSGKTSVEVRFGKYKAVANIKVTGYVGSSAGGDFNEWAPGDGFGSWTPPSIPLPPTPPGESGSGVSDILGESSSGVDDIPSESGSGVDDILDDL
jgi:Bacterial Ig-like domain (group 2)